MFYPPQGMPPQARPGFYPPQMIPPQQRRWNGPGAPPPPGQPQAYGQPGGIPPPQFARGQMPPQAGGPRGMPPHARPQAQQPMQVPAARPPGRGGYKYAANTRNAPPPAGLVGVPAAQAPAPAAQPANPTLNASTLAALPEDMQKQTLGEALFPKIVEFAGDMSGKVTGMLLEMDNGELLHLLEDSDALKEKVTEATSVLEEHMKSSA